MDEITRMLASRLTAERKLRHWSLADLAAKAGVSRAMISRIERGEVSATAALLARLAQAFDLTLASLFAPAATRPSPLMRKAGQPLWRDPASGYVRRAVAVADEQYPVDVVEVEFPAGASVFFDHSREDGPSQYVWLLEGQMRVSLGGDTHELQQGDCLAMRLAAPIVFHNPAGKPARYAIIHWRATPASLTLP